jgi:hypothetical protein
MIACAVTSALLATNDCTLFWYSVLSFSWDFGVTGTGGRLAGRVLL